MRYGQTSTLLILVVWFLAGCTMWEAGDGTPHSLDRQIYYGTPDTNMAVVAITNGPGTGYFCSGTLITPNVVMTAAHCLYGSSTSNVQVMFGNSVGSGTYVQTSEALIHPGYDDYSLVNDIALLRLSSSAPANVAPIPALPPGLALSAADEGSSIDISGFGQTEYNTSGDKLHVSVALSKVCPDGANGCSFGSGWAVPASIGYPRSPGGTCYGDSGGPAFLDRAGVTYAVGVTSYGDQGCTIWGVSTKVDDFSSFINNFIGSVIPEDCSTAGDEDGDGLADCLDPECALHPNCLGPDACTQAASIGCGDQINATTVGATAQFLSYSCLTSSTEDGPEVAYEITAPAGTSVTATLNINGSGDLDLFLLPDDGGTSCSPSSCLDGSTNGSNSPESLTFTVPANGGFLVVDTWDTASPFTLSLSCGGNTQVYDEDCTNLIDDNGDGLVDCQDADCAMHEACLPDKQGGEQCANGLDDDGDGFADCQDPDCGTHPACVPEESGGEICGNGLDDDGNGVADCEDPACALFPGCDQGDPGSENCFNGVDDDGDMIVDCYDPDCSSHPACADPATGPQVVRGGCSQSGSSQPAAPYLVLLLGMLIAIRARRHKGA